MNELQPTTDFDNVVATLSHETDAGRLEWRFRAGSPSVPLSSVAAAYLRRSGVPEPKGEPVAYEATEGNVTFVLARLVSSLARRERLLLTATEDVVTPSGHRGEPLFTYMAEPGDAWFPMLDDLLRRVEADFSKRTAITVQEPEIRRHERVQRALSVFPKQAA